MYQLKYKTRYGMELSPLWASTRITLLGSLAAAMQRGYRIIFIKSAGTPLADRELEDLLGEARGHQPVTHNLPGALSP